MIRLVFGLPLIQCAVAHLVTVTLIDSFSDNIKSFREVNLSLQSRQLIGGSSQLITAKCTWVLILSSNSIKNDMWEVLRQATSIATRGKCNVLLSDVPGYAGIDINEMAFIALDEVLKVDFESNYFYLFLPHIIFISDPFDTLV